MAPEPVDLEDLERRRPCALVEADVSTASELHAEDYELISPFGDTWSKDEYLGGFRAGDLDDRLFEPDGEVRSMLIGDAAVVRYVARIEIHSPGGDDSGRFWHTDIWRLRDGQWQAVWSQATRIHLD